MDTKLLGIYLNDHLSGSRSGLELARRALRENRDNAVGRYLQNFVKEVEDERTVLRQIMRALGVLPNEFKLAAAVVLERLGTAEAQWLPRALLALEPRGGAGGAVRGGDRQALHVDPAEAARASRRGAGGL